MLKDLLGALGSIGVMAGLPLLVLFLSVGAEVQAYVTLLVLIVSAIVILTPMKYPTIARK